MKEHAGDFVGEHGALLARLRTANLITEEEAGVLLKMYQIGFDAGEPTGDPQRAFFASREIYAGMAASGTASPIALVVASTAVGAFELTENPAGAPEVTAFRRSYAQSGAAIGAGIGAMIGGPAGAVLGGEIGGLIGGIVDSKDKK